MHGGVAGVQQPDHALALVLDRPHLGQVGHGPGHVEEPDHPTGRRRVDHHRVVGVAAVPVLGAGAPHALLDLPGEQHVPQAGRERGGELDRPHPAQRPPGEAQVVEHRQVLQQRGLRVDGQRAHLPAAGRGRDVLLGVGQRGEVEQLGDALPALHLDQQHPAATGGQGQGQGGGHRGLAGATLAGDHVQTRPGEFLGPAGGTGRHRIRLSAVSPGPPRGRASSPHFHLGPGPRPVQRPSGADSAAPGRRGRDPAAHR